MALQAVAKTTESTAGGTINPKEPALAFRINGKVVARVGDPVEKHGKGKHAAAVIETGHPKITVNGISICRNEVDQADCDHKVSASGKVRA